MLKVSRRCTREKLLQTRRAVTTYAATPVVVIGPGTKRQSGAFASLAELVQHQVAQQHAHGPIRMASDPRHYLCGCMPVVANIYHSGGVFVGVWPGGPRAVGVLVNRATWWVMAAADDHAWLCGMDEVAGLNSPGEHLEANGNIVLENGQTIGFECFPNGEGKGMQVSNYSPVTKCWTSEVGDSLELHDNVTPMARWGAVLRAVGELRVWGTMHIVRHGFAMQLPSD